MSSLMKCSPSYDDLSAFGSSTFGSLVLPLFYDVNSQLPYQSLAEHTLYIVAATIS